MGIIPHLLITKHISHVPCEEYPFYVQKIQLGSTHAEFLTRCLPFGLMFSRIW